MRNVWKIFVVLGSLSIGSAACDPPSASDESAGAGGGDEASGGSDASGGEGQGARAPLDPCAGFASEVIDVEYGAGAGFGQDQMPDIVLGAPRGAGETSGSLDVLALGNGGVIVLGFGDQRIVDREGPDFIVFENAFYAGGDPEAPFAELATVEVSEDGESWSAFPCDALEAPYGSCAGWHPVLAGEGARVSAHDPSVAGGDAFDLADLGLASARFVRIVDRADLGGLAGSFDLDAVALVHWTCEP